MADAPPPVLTVVVPAYEEEAVIADTLATVHAYFSSRALAHEIVVVDDGSTDCTTRIVADAAATHPEIRLVPQPHRGKGGAVRGGVLAARGRWVLFMDADLSTPIDQWERLEPLLRGGAEVVIGSRKVEGAAVEVHQPRIRELLGKTFTALTRLLVVGASDVTCGFKAFDADAARRIFALQRLDGWAFDAEILFIAERLGYRIHEVPVVWRDDPTTKVRILRDGLTSFRDLVSIRLAALRGRYPRR